MESTLLISFLKASRLWQWLSNLQSPPIFQEIKTVFNKIYKSIHLYDNPRNDDPTHQALDISTPKTIPQDLKAMLNVSQSKIYLRTHIKIQGICYTCSETHVGNSLVHFYPNGDQGKSCIPGWIKYIYSTDGVHYALAIQWQIPLPDNRLDPFAQYLHSPTKTYSSKHSLLEHVDLDWIFCHYTCWDLSPDYSVVLSLSLRYVLQLLNNLQFYLLSTIGMMSILYFIVMYLLTQVIWLLFQLLFLPPNTSLQFFLSHVPTVFLPFLNQSTEFISMRCHTHLSHYYKLER